MQPYVTSWGSFSLDPVLFHTSSSHSLSPIYQNILIHPVQPNTLIPQNSQPKKVTKHLHQPRPAGYIYKSSSGLNKSNSKSISSFFCCCCATLIGLGSPPSLIFLRLASTLVARLPGFRRGLCSSGSVSCVSWVPVLAGAGGGSMSPSTASCASR